MYQAQNLKTTSFEEFMKPAKDFTSHKLHEAVKLRIGSTATGLSATKPITLPQFFRENCEKYAERAALSYQPPPDQSESENNAATNWITLTYADYAAKVEQVALMLLQLGLEPQTGVGILAHNCPEWFYVNFGAIQAGGIAFGIYQTSSADAVHHMLFKADATICIVDDALQMEKVRTVHARLPKLRAVVQLNAPFAEFVGHVKGYYKWQELLEAQHKNNVETMLLRQELRRRESEIYANQCCTLVYTSGTTGFPKGVMLSHDNIVFNTKTVYAEMFKDLENTNFEVISYLPLSHVGGQTFEMYASLYLGAQVHFADRNALKGTLLLTTLKVRPTMFLGVPRVFEKFREYIIEKQKTEKSPLDIKKLLGLERCKWCFVGAAPALADLREFYVNANIELYVAYGLSEIAGASIINYNYRKLNAVGKPAAGVEMKIVATPKLKNDDGEICLRGRNVFMGYLDEPLTTAETIDADGWLQSGDAGYIDDEGDLIVTGRLKELIITTGGENIPFLLIESTIKEELPMISNAMVIGDGRKYLTVLLTLKSKPDPTTGLPTDKLNSDVLKRLSALNISCNTVSELLSSKETFSVIEADIKVGLERANSRALSNAQRVQKFRLLPQDFSTKTQEFGPTLKTRRGFILEKYAKLIDEMYN